MLAHSEVTAQKSRFRMHERTHGRMDRRTSMRTNSKEEDISIPHAFHFSKQS